MAFSKSGSTRLAVPCFGENVCKIPRVSVREVRCFLTSSDRSSKTQKIKLASKFILNELTVGIKSNKLEASEACRDLTKFFLKTRLSIFGLFNFQEKLHREAGIAKIKDEIETKSPPLIQTMAKLAKKEPEPTSDAVKHHLIPDNWGFDKSGKVKFCDGGNKLVLDFIKKHCKGFETLI